jgi:hypothetical protein
MSTRTADSKAASAEMKAARERLQASQAASLAAFNLAVASQKRPISQPDYSTRNAWLREPAQVAA